MWVDLKKAPDPFSVKLIQDTIQNEKLQNIFNNLYRVQDKLPGGTAGALKFEQEAGQLLSPAGHMEKAQTTITSLNKLIQTGNLSSSDTLIAQTLLNQLTQSVSGK